MNVPECINYHLPVSIQIYPPTPADSRGSASEKRAQEMAQKMDAENQSPEQEASKQDAETRQEKEGDERRKQVARERKGS